MRISVIDKHMLNDHLNVHAKDVTHTCSEVDIHFREPSYLFTSLLMYVK